MSNHSNHKDNQTETDSRVLTVRATLRCGSQMEMRLETEASQAASLWGKTMEMLHLMGAMPHAVRATERTVSKSASEPRA